MKFIDFLRKNKEDIILVSPTSLFEALVHVGYSEEIFKKYKKRVHVCLRKHQLELLHLFNQFPEKVKFYSYDDKEMWHLAESRMFLRLNLSNNQNLVCAVYFNDDYPFNYLAEFINSFGKRGLNVCDTYKYIFNIPFEIKIKKFSFYFDEKKFKRRYHIENYKKIALFQIGANTTGSLNEHVINELITKVYEKGYTIIINTKGARCIPNIVVKIPYLKLDLGIVDAVFMMCVSNLIYTTGSGIAQLFLFAHERRKIKNKINILLNDYYFILNNVKIERKPFDTNKNCYREIITCYEDVNEWLIPNEATIEMAREIVDCIVNEKKETIFFLN